LRWWWNRIARLVPPYLVAVLVTFTVLAWVQMPGLAHPTLHTLWGDLTLRETFDPTVGYVDPSYWTLPLQLFAFTVAALLVRRVRWANRPWALPALSWALIASPLVIRLYAGNIPVRTLYSGVAINRWHLFGMGVAIWLWSQRRMALEHLALLLVCGLFANYLQDFGEDTNYGVTMIVGAVAVLMCVTATGTEWLGPLTRVLAKPLSWLAGISYGIYLLHQQLGYLIAVSLHRAGIDGWSRLGVVLTAGILLGWLITKLVERPVHRHLVHTLPRQLAEAGHAVRVWTVSATVAIRITRLQVTQWLRSVDAEPFAEPAHRTLPVPSQLVDREADVVDVDVASRH
jgi:peptidoglycan/LPS O-acetylase OafA/YrhL